MIIMKKFQSSLTVRAIKMTDGIPQIDQFQIPSEQISGNRRVNIEEFFSSGLALKIYKDVSKEFWPHLFTKLLVEADHVQIYPVLSRMIRKDAKSTSRTKEYFSFFIQSVTVSL